MYIRKKQYICNMNPAADMRRHSDFCGNLAFAIWSCKLERRKFQSNERQIGVNVCDSVGVNLSSFTASYGCNLDSFRPRIASVGFEGHNNAFK